MSEKKLLISIAVVFILLTLMLTMLPSFATDVIASTADTNEIVSVRLNKKLDTVEIGVRLTDDYAADKKGTNIYLFELLPYQSVSQINSMEYVTTEKVSKNVTFKVPFDRSDVQQLYAKYVAAERLADGSYSIITGAYYIENPDAIAERNYEYPKYESKKGLQIQLLTDAQELGISHTILNVPINEYILTEGGSNAVSYIYDNKTYYIDSEKLTLLDHKIKILTEAGVNVYLNIILSSRELASSSALSCLYAAEKSDEAALYALNTKSRDGMMYYQSILSFLAERYTREDQEYGFAGSFIIGYEINSNRNWNYMGSISLNNYLNSYIVALRVADTALRSIYSNGRVYVSVANNFNVLANDTGSDVDVNLDYAAKDLIILMNYLIKYSGDIPWNLAINPYPSDEGNANFWNDDLSYEDYTTPYITMKNIGTLTAFMSQEDFYFNGNKRSVLISEFGINSTEDEDSQRHQAAAYAYAYYKAVADPMIEALIYHRHVDHSGENGYKYGLWTNQENTTVTPSAKKYIYDVFKYIDTERGEEATSFALSIIGAKSWDALIEGYNTSQAAVKEVIDDISILSSDISAKYKKNTLFDFSKGSLCGFYPTDNAEYIELRSEAVEDEKTESKLYAKLYSLEKFGYMGVGRNFAEPLSIKKTGYVSFDIKADVPEEVTSVTVMLRLFSTRKNEVVYEGIAQIAPNEWETLTFKITELADITDSITGLKIWIKPYDDNIYSGDFGLWLGNVDIYDKSSVTFLSVLLKLLLVIAILFTFVVIIVVVRYFIYRRRQKMLMEKRKQARIAQMQRTQASLYNNSGLPSAGKINGAQNQIHRLQQGQKVAGDQIHRRRPTRNPAEFNRGGNQNGNRNS